MVAKDPDTHHGTNEQGNKTGQVYGRLKSMIVFQKLPPRTPLEMKIIADRMGVSATPVREALILLAQEGLIAKHGSRSYLTRPLNVSEVENDFEMAFMIMKFSLESGTSPFDPTGLRISDATLLAARPAEQRAQEVAISVESLHERIAGLTRNERIVGLVREFNFRSSFIRQLDLQNRERLEETVGAMGELMTLVKTANFRGAIENLEKQYQRKRAMIPALVREGNLRALDAVNIFEQ